MKVTFAILALSSVLAFTQAGTLDAVKGVPLAGQTLSTVKDVPLVGQAVGTAGTVVPLRKRHAKAAETAKPAGKHGKRGLADGLLGSLTGGAAPQAVAPATPAANAVTFHDAAPKALRRRRVDVAARIDVDGLLDVLDHVLAKVHVHLLGDLLKDLIKKLKDLHVKIDADIHLKLEDLLQKLLDIHLDAKIDLHVWIQKFIKEHIHLDVKDLLKELKVALGIKIEDLIVDLNKLGLHILEKDIVHIKHEHEDKPIVDVHALVKLFDHGLLGLDVDAIVHVAVGDLLDIDVNALIKI